LDSNLGSLSVQPGAIIDYEANAGLLWLNLTVMDTAMNIRTNASDSYYCTTQIKVYLVDVNEPPYLDIYVPSFTINENLPVNTVIGNVHATDPEPPNTVTYQLVNDTGVVSLTAGVFKVLNASYFNYENRQSFLVPFRFYDSTGLSVNSNITIFLLNINDMPVFTDTTIHFSEMNHTELLSKGSTWTYVLTIQGIDEDVGDTLTYSIPTILSEDINYIVNSTTGQLYVDAALLDFESWRYISTSIVCSDGKSPVTQTLKIYVDQVNENPLAFIMSANISLAENSPNGTLLSSFWTVNDSEFSDLYYLKSTYNIDTFSDVMIPNPSVSRLMVTNPVYLDSTLSFTSIPSIFNNSFIIRPKSVEAYVTSVTQGQQIYYRMDVSSEGTVFVLVNSANRNTTPSWIASNGFVLYSTSSNLQVNASNGTMSVVYDIYTKHISDFTTFAIGSQYQTNETTSSKLMFLFGAFPGTFLI